MNDNAKIKTVSMGMLEEHPNIQYSDGDIVIFEDVAELTRGQAYLFEMVMMAFCTNGKCQLVMNGKQLDIASDTLVICPPKAIIEDIMISPDFKCFVIALSYNGIQNTMQMDKRIWDIRMFLLNNPVVHLEPKDKRLGSLYYQLISLKMGHPNGTFHKDVMRSLFECLFYELASVIHPFIDDTPTDDAVTQGDLLFKRFMELLGKTEGRERSVKKFADQLCVTPKYLSTAIKNASGKTALKWIHIVAVENIKRQLKFTDRSIKEIADDMQFPNLSFFGKFVRAHLGMSPSECRQRVFSERKETENER